MYSLRIPYSIAHDIPYSLNVSRISRNSSNDIALFLHCEIQYNEAVILAYVSIIVMMSAYLLSVLVCDKCKTLRMHCTMSQFYIVVSVVRLVSFCVPYYNNVSCVPIVGFPSIKSQIKLCAYCGEIMLRSSLQTPAVLLGRVSCMRLRFRFGVIVSPCVGSQFKNQYAVGLRK